MFFLPYLPFDNPRVSRLNKRSPMILSRLTNPPQVQVLPKVLMIVWMARPHFVVGSAIVYSIGALVARSETHALNWPALGLGLGVVWLVQLATHLHNEYADRSADALNAHRTFFSGGSGILQTRALSPRAALRAGTGTLLLAILLFLTLTAQPTFGPVTALIFGLAALGATVYSVPPLTLAYRGWGALDTTIIAGLLTPLLAYNLQTGRISATLLSACLPLVALVFANTITVALPDYEADRTVGKRTLVVHLGPRRAAALYTIALVVGYAFAFLILPWSWPAVLAGAAALFVGALSLYVLWSGGYRLPQRLGLNTFLGISAFLAVAAAEAIAFWVAG
jgi:1,4-dihydroxy-2-naphthoate octaprenyltransferase